MILISGKPFSSLLLFSWLFSYLLTYFSARFLSFSCCFFASPATGLILLTSCWSHNPSRGVLGPWIRKRSGGGGLAGTNYETFFRKVCLLGSRVSASLPCRTILAIVAKNLSQITQEKKNTLIYNDAYFIFRCYFFGLSLLKDFFCPVTF